MTDDNTLIGLLEEPETTTETPTQADVSPTPAPTPAGGFDAKELAKQFGEQLKGILPAQQAAAPRPELTPEQAKKLLNVWEPDDNFLQEFSNLETQKVAFAKMRDGMTKQMLTIVQSLMGERDQQFEQRLSPLQEFYAAQQERELQSAFAKSYPALDKPELAPLVQTVANSLAGKQFASREAGFEALAKGVESFIKAHNPEFTLTAAKAATTSPGRQATRMPVTSGGAGGQGGATAPSSKNKAVSLL